MPKLLLSFAAHESMALLRATRLLSAPLARLQPLPSVARFRALSSAPASRVSNPLLDVDVATSHGASSTEVPMGIANIKSMAVSYKKLRHVANLAQGLRTWRMSKPTAPMLLVTSEKVAPKNEVSTASFNRRSP